MVAVAITVVSSAVVKRFITARWMPKMRPWRIPMEAEDTGQSSKATVWLLAIIAGAAGTIGSSVMVSDIDPVAKAMLGPLFFTLVVVLAFVAMGKHERFILAWKERVFERKIRRYPQHVRVIFDISDRVWETVSLFFNRILPEFRNQFAGTVLSHELLCATTNSILAVRTEAQHATELLRPRYRVRHMRTSNFYSALNQMIVVMNMVGMSQEAIVEDIRKAGDSRLEGDQLTYLTDIYEKFRQEYLTLCEKIRGYAADTSRLFGKKVEFDPPYLLPLRT